MRRIVLTSPGVLDFQIVPDIDEKQLGEHQLLLNIKRIGICGSEIHSYHGQHPATLYPVVQGHEYSAIVVAVGKDVSVAKAGDAVTCRPQLVCGKCAPCRRGQYNVCENLRVQAFQADGAAQDLFVVDEDRVVRLPEGMSLDYGAMIEPAAVGAHATSRTDVRGKNVVVSGAGTIGNLVAQFAMARGARKVLITDISDRRLEIARECGLIHTANVARMTLKDACQETFGEEGFQVGFEVAGVESSVRSLMECIEKGSDIVVVAVFAKDPALSMYYLGEHELRLTGTMMYRHEDYEKAVECVSDSTIDLAPLVTNRFSFQNYDNAYKYIDSNRESTMKVIIDLEARPSVVGIGELVWDILPGGPRFGGAPVNFAYFAHKNGADAHIISAVGKDEPGDRAIKIMTDNGLDADQVQTLEGRRTGKVNVMVDDDGQPEYDIERDSAWDCITVTDGMLDLVSKADCVCWGLLAQRSEISRASILRLLDASQPSCVKVFDINIRQNYYSKELIDESLRRADIFKLNDEEFELLAGLYGVSADSLVQELFDTYSISLVVLTFGASCSRIYDRTGLVSDVATPKVKVIDTVGAGDSFTATFVTDLLKGKTIKSAHKHSVEVSARVCERKGAINID